MDRERIRGTLTRVLLILTAIAALSPVIGFVSSITTPFIRDALTIGRDQRFHLCSTYDVCHREIARFERFLSRNVNNLVTLDITYEEGFTFEERCGVNPLRDATFFMEVGTFAIPLLGSAECTFDDVVIMPADAVILNTTSGTNVAVYRAFGRFVVGRSNFLFVLTEIENL